MYFLFGKEKAIEYGIQGLSDFGGGQEKNETIFEGAIREGCEELTGFYGNATQLREKIKNAGGTFKVNHKILSIIILVYKLFVLLVTLGQGHRYPP